MEVIQPKITFIDFLLRIPRWTMRHYEKFFREIDLLFPICGRRIAVPSTTPSDIN
jgi:hypothetical protein